MREGSKSTPRFFSVTKTLADWIYIGMPRPFSSANRYGRPWGRPFPRTKVRRRHRSLLGPAVNRKVVDISSDRPAAAARPLDLELDVELALRPAQEVRRFPRR